MCLCSFHSTNSCDLHVARETVHLFLLAIYIVAVICKVIRCRRWPVAKKQETPASDDIRLEEIESCDHRQQQTLLVDSTPLELLPPTSATEQREPSPRGSPYPLPQEGGVVAVEGVHDQIGSAGGYTPRPLEVQVEMTEVQQQKPLQHYQLSQPLYESSSRQHTCTPLLLRWLLN